MPTNALDQTSRSQEITYLTTGARMALLVAGLFIAHLLDAVVLEHVSVEWPGRFDLYQFFRVFGYLPLWILITVAMVMTDWHTVKTRGVAGLWRGFILIGTVLACAAASECLKLLIRRERPDVSDIGNYDFRPISEDFFDSSGLGMPSGHAMIAFGGAWMLSRLFPAAAPVWIFAAAGCAGSRLFSQAHYLSDVCLSAIVSYFIARFIWTRRPAM